MTEEVYTELKSLKLQVYEAVERRLAGGVHARLNYDELADELACSRHAVKYNIKKLLAAGVLAYDGYRLFLP